MNITIHRGAKEIGGTCIELCSGSSRILIDFGLPLVDEHKEDLIHRGVLPEINGLYKDDAPLIDAILLSHPHPDHYGLLSYVNSTIPIYMSRGCQLLLDVSYYFGQTDCDLGNVPIVEVHASGHAYIEELKELVTAIKPANIIPIHTFYPEKYSEYFGCNVKIIKDKVPVEV